MKPEFENIQLIKNEDDNRFELTFNDKFAFIDFKESSSQISLIHTEVDPDLKGTGAASALVKKTLQFIENTKKKILPFCPFVFAYIKKHPEWKRIVDERFKGYDKL